MDNSAQSFHLPQNLSLNQQMPFCLSVIRRQRDEILPLRKKITMCQTYHSPLAEQLKEWKDKYKKKEEENKKLQKKIERLKKEIENLTKTNERYRVAVFDHGNFKHPNNQDKKPKGGQKGHANTNKDGERNYASFKRERVHAQVCGACGNPLSRTASIKEKTLIDIEINPQLLQLIVQSERQWCNACKKEVRATHPQSLPFTEYGINTFMAILYLRFKGKQSFETISCTLNNLFGLPITKSGIGTILFQAKEYLEEKYEELKQAIRNGEIMHNDETGWMVRGKSAWMWIMTTPDKKHADGSIETGITVYAAAESRGKGIFKEMYGNSHAYSMHDGNSSYEGITGKEKTVYCWSHVIRFAFEEAVTLPAGHLACLIRDRLVDLYQTVRIHTEYTKEEKEKILRSQLDNILLIQSADNTVKNIQQRVATQKEGLILALLITEDGTNNLAEREFRQLAISRNISYGSDTYKGMETTAILASVVQTIQRDKTKLFFPTLKFYLQEEVQNKYPRYKHNPLFDT